MQCPICGNNTFGDQRTLTLNNLYKLSEVSDKLKDNGDGSFSIPTCKDCRGDFMGILRRWLDGEFTSNNDVTAGPFIPTRVHGRVVNMTIEQHEEFRKTNRS